MKKNYGSGHVTIRWMGAGLVCLSAILEAIEPASISPYGFNLVKVALMGIGIFLLAVGG